MAKKQNKPATAVKPNSKPANKRRNMVLIALLAAICLGAYYIIGVKKQQGPPNLDGDLTAEKTLTAANPRLQLLSAKETGVDFENTIIEDEEHNVIRNINFYNGGGVTVADINNDNLPDIYFVCTNGKNRLYLNQGNFKFKDITDFRLLS